MIIECHTCHTRFRLDESRIRGRGARVKCRKCGDSIVVLKDSAPTPTPPAPGGDGFLDLGSAVRDPSDGSSGPPPPVGNLIPFPAPFRPAGPIAAEPSPSAVKAEKAEKDEIDLAFEKVLSAPVEASSPSTGETETEIPGPAEAGVPVEDAAPAGEGPRPEMDLGSLTLDLQPEEKLEIPPVPEPGPPFGEPPAVEPPTEFRGEGGFLISDSDTLDFLQEKHPDAGAQAPPGVGDISLEISSTPIDETRPTLREPDAAPTPSDEWASPTPGGIPFEGNATPPAAAPVLDVPPHREEEPPHEAPVESPGHRGSPAPEPPRPRSSAGPVAAAVLALLLAAGGYLGFTSSGRRTLEGAIPGVAALWGGKPAGTAAAKYDLRNVIGYYESGSASPRILVIKGQVANLSTAEKSGIRVHATLLDNTDAVLAQTAVYAGNVLSGETLRQGDRNILSKSLENRFGEGLANMHVGPGKAIPFMVVFFDAPENMDSYKLEAKDGE